MFSKEKRQESYQIATRTQAGYDHEGFGVRCEGCTKRRSVLQKVHETSTNCPQVWILVTNRSMVSTQNMGVNRTMCSQKENRERRSTEQARRREVLERSTSVVTREFWLEPAPPSLFIRVREMLGFGTSRNFWKPLDCTW